MELDRNENLKSGRNHISNLSTASSLFTRHLLVAYFFSSTNTFSFLAFCLPILFVLIPRVSDHTKQLEKPENIMPKFTAHTSSSSGLTRDRPLTRAWPRRGASYPFPGSLPRPALLILLTWIFTSHKPIFGRGQAFCVAT